MVFAGTGVSGSKFEASFLFDFRFLFRFFLSDKGVSAAIDADSLLGVDREIAAAFAVGAGDFSLPFDTPFLSVFGVPFTASDFFLFF